MKTVSSRTLDSVTLHEVLPAAKPAARARMVASDGSDPVTRILAVLLSSRFRKGSLTTMDAEGFVARHHDRLAARVARNEPVQFTLVGFPFKVPNPLKVGGRTLPDLAEVAALRTLERLHSEVQEIHEPGIEVVILHDGAYIAEAFGVPRQEAHEYTNYFRWLLRATGTDAFIRCEDVARLLRGHQCDGAAQATIPRVGDNEDAAFRKTLGMLNVRWVRRESLPRVYEEVREGDPATFTGEAAALHAQVRRSMALYALCDEVLHRFDPRPYAFPEAIHATTKEQPGRLALWLVRRGRSLLPWHGLGVLDENGHVEVRYAADVEADDDYRPVFLEGETTPFLYERV
jgi:Pyoverdine/dityrosine biosynthesis protein